MATLEKGRIIGEFDLYDYGLPTKKGYLFHQVTHGGNEGNGLPENREYLRVVGFTKDNQMIEYGYIYFMLYVSKDGIPISKYIGSKVIDDYRNKGLGDLLMSIYLYYSYDNGFTFVESTTRQRKLDLLSLMNKYGFTVRYPENYDNGERVTLYKNHMVVDIYKKNTGGLYYRFKSKKAEEVYRRDNAKIADSYNYLPSQEKFKELNNFEKMGWIVPNEDYERTILDNRLIDENLDKSRFSK